MVDVQFLSEIHTNGDKMSQVLTKGPSTLEPENAKPNLSIVLHNGSDWDTILHVCRKSNKWGQREVCPTC